MFFISYFSHRPATTHRQVAPMKIYVRKSKPNGPNHALELTVPRVMAAAPPLFPHRLRPRSSHAALHGRLSLGSLGVATRIL